MEHLSDIPETPEIEALVTLLESLYPERCLRPGEDKEKALAYSGKVDLVKQLREALNQEEEED